MDYESAEFTKISINAYLAASITTTNSLNTLARSVGANWHLIKEALKLDRRIGEYAYLNPGLGISGGNIERDLRTLDTFSKEKLLSGTNIFFRYLENSRYQKNWVLSSIKKHILDFNPTSKIGILGIAYKEDTNSTKNSIALEVADKYRKNLSGAYDPIAKFPSEYSHIHIFDSALDCVSKSDAIVILTPWKEFEKLDLTFELKNRAHPLLVIDPFGIMKRDYKLANVVFINSNEM